MQAPPPGSVPPVMPGGPVGMANMGFNRAASQADLINHQNQAHEQLERRRRMEMEKERAAAAAAARERSGGTSGQVRLRSFCRFEVVFRNGVDWSSLVLVTLPSILLSSFTAILT